MRLFVAIDIEPAIRERLARFRSEMKALAPAARWVGVETFHITLKFIGERPPEQMDSIVAALSSIHGSPAAVSFRDTGFFPTPRSARVFWVGIDADPALAQFAGDRPNAVFAPLQQKLAEMHSPDFGSMTATEFFLYESRLSPAGAQYTKLARFPLR
jgi:2'-5' RNA ligase